MTSSLALQWRASHIFTISFLSILCFLLPLIVLGFLWFMCLLFLFCFSSIHHLLLLSFVKGTFTSRQHAILMSSGDFTQLSQSTHTIFNNLKKEQDNPSSCGLFGFSQINFCLVEELTLPTITYWNKNPTFQPNEFNPCLATLTTLSSLDFSNIFLSI